LRILVDRVRILAVLRKNYKKKLAILNLISETTKQLKDSWRILGGFLEDSWRILFNSRVRLLSGLINHFYCGTGILFKAILCGFLLR